MLQRRHQCYSFNWILKVSLALKVVLAKLVHQPVELQQIVDNACLQLQSTLTEAGATVTTASLPKVTGDESLLTQLLQNLIGNAIKFQPAGAKPRVHVSASPTTAGRQQIQIKDNGIGIDPHHQDRVFEVFRRLQPHGRAEGSGIGLATVKRIIERHRGRQLDEYTDEILQILLEL